MKKINKDIKELAFENIIWKSSIANRKVIESFYDYFNGLIKQNGGKYEITFEKKINDSWKYISFQKWIVFKNGKEIVLYSFLWKWKSNGIFVYAPKWDSWYYFLFYPFQYWKVIKSFLF